MSAVTIYAPEGRATARSRPWGASAKSAASHVGVSTAVVIGGTPYDGVYVVTPGKSAQTLHTEARTLAQDVVIGAIPRNYGLITWDGNAITVS